MGDGGGRGGPRLMKKESEKMNSEPRVDGSMAVGNQPR